MYTCDLMNDIHPSDGRKILDDPPLFLTHKTRRFRFGPLIHPARISQEQLYVTALWSLSHRKHDQRTPPPGHLSIGGRLFMD